MYPLNWVGLHVHEERTMGEEKKAAFNFPFFLFKFKKARLPLSTSNYIYHDRGNKLLTTYKC